MTRDGHKGPEPVAVPQPAGLAQLLARAEVYDLGRPMYNDMPQAEDHARFRMLVHRRHGDRVRADGTSGASETIITGGHVGTHIDALSHIAHRGCLHGGIDAAEALVDGRYVVHGVETLAPIVAPAILLDVPAALGIDTCPAAYEITPDELEAALCLAEADPRPGDVLLVRSGWGRRFGEPAYSDFDQGAPGPGEPAAAWLAGFRPRAVGSDTIAFERIPAGTSDYTLPVHRLMLVDRGIPIIEVLDLERLSADRVLRFTLLLSPLKLVGATGSPVRPIALVDPLESRRG